MKTRPEKVREEEKGRPAHPHLLTYRRTDGWMASPGEGRAWTRRTTTEDSRIASAAWGRRRRCCALAPLPCPLPPLTVEQEKEGVGLCRRRVHSATSRRCLRCWCSGMVMGGRLQQPCHRRPSMPPGPPIRPVTAVVNRAEKNSMRGGDRFGTPAGYESACWRSLHFLIVEMACQKRQGAEHLANREGCLETWTVRVRYLPA